MTEDIKYSYLRDPMRPERVITVARKIDKQYGLIRFAIAVCRPKNYWVKKNQDWSKHLKMRMEGFRTDGDEFSKSLGRAIAGGRLYEKGNELPLLPDESPMLSIAKHMSNMPTPKGKGEMIRRTFEQYVQERV